MAAPRVAPEKRPSVIKAISLSKPIPLKREVGVSISLIPGPPLGPSYLITITSPFCTTCPMIAFVASSSESKTLAGPSWTNISGATAALLTTAPSGARLPNNILNPPVAEYACNAGIITSLSPTLADSIVWDNGLPVTVITYPCSNVLISFMTELIPPARSKSWICRLPDGLILQRWGVCLLISFTCARENSTPASWAIAIRCNTLFVLPPNAISTAKALAIASSFIMSLGLISLANNCNICFPVSFAKRTRWAITAGIVPFPGKAIPKASARQFIVLAVNIPAQLPQPGHAFDSNSRNLSAVISPFTTLPTAIKTVFKSISWVPKSLLLSQWPASMGPPLTNMEGIFNLTAPINIPGIILSQLGIKTRASKAWASATISTESAIVSRLGRLYFIPGWFIAIPSQTPIVFTSKGTPPASLTPAFTASARCLRCIWPGIISLKLLVIPIKGFSNSVGVQPRA